MKIKNKRRFAISMTVLITVTILLLTLLTFGIVKGIGFIMGLIEDKTAPVIPDIPAVTQDVVSETPDVVGEGDGTVGGEDAAATDEAVVPEDVIPTEEVVPTQEPVATEEPAEEGTIGAHFDSSILAVADFSSWGITWEYFAKQPVPEKDELITKVDLAYSVKESYFETQDDNNASGYAAAYFLRCAKKEVTGNEAYYSMQNEVLPNGYHFPGALKNYIDKKGVKTEMYTGNIDTLKSRLVKTKQPLIVLVGDSLNWQHYLNFVGYDTLKTELYFVDSNTDGDLNGELPGNRTMQVSEFERVWNNDLAVYNNFYIAAK